MPTKLFEPILDLIGQRFGRLVVLRSFANGGGRGRILECRCDCGNIVERRSDHLKKTKTNGCEKCETQRRSQSRSRHGEFLKRKPGETKTRLWRTWSSMRERCSNPNVGCWPNYGGKGVRVCAAWEDFSVFREWALRTGYTDEMTIERRDAHLGYSPENCEWLPKSENSRRAAQNRNAKWRLNRLLDSNDPRPHFPIEMFFGHA